MNSSELRFLVDVGVGKGIERYLQEEGYDTKAVRDIDPRMEDEEIIRTPLSRKIVWLSQWTKISENWSIVLPDSTAAYYCSG